MDSFRVYFTLFRLYSNFLQRTRQNLHCARVFCLLKWVKSLLYRKENTISCKLFCAKYNLSHASWIQCAPVLVFAYLEDRMQYLNKYEHSVQLALYFARSYGGIMKTVGIIAEYNPFHTGHEYHIKKAKEAAKADYAIVVMSPDFVQRGEPAVFDKYTRTRMALLGGADLVIELPLCYATGSAEYFAEGAVAMLDALGTVDTLCFGSETDHVDLFLKTAAILLNEPKEYTQALREELKAGRTYPQARSAALGKYLAKDGVGVSATDKQTGSADAIMNFLSTPNNILGIEYCKALLKRGSKIAPLPIKRQGSAYNSSVLEGDFCSATALRSGIAKLYRSDSQSTNLSFQRTDSQLAGLSFLKTDSQSTDLLSYIPRDCQELFAASIGSALTSEDFLAYLNQKLLSLETFDSVLDISSDLSDRICSQRYKCIGKPYAEIVALLKTRQITEARIRRALLHLILDIQADIVEEFRQNGSVFYARVLGFRKTSSPLLHQLKQQTRIPLVVKTAAAEKEFMVCSKELAAAGNEFAVSTKEFTTTENKFAINTKDFTAVTHKMWQQDLYASHLYRSVLARKYNIKFKTEYEYSPIIL